MDSFMTSTIKVQRVEGESLSPLLFNLTVNTLINTVKSKKVECMGYVYQDCLSRFLVGFDLLIIAL